MQSRMILVEIIVDYWQYLNKHILTKPVKGIKGHPLLCLKSCRRKTQITAKEKVNSDELNKLFRQKIRRKQRKKEIFPLIDHFIGRKITFYWEKKKRTLGN